MKKYNLIIMMTYKCNYNCTYCNIKKNKSSLNVEKLDSIIHFINKNIKNIGSIKFFGGEPLLEFDRIKKIIDGVNNNSVTFEIITNGTLLSEKNLTYINNAFSKVGVSMDFEHEYGSEFFNKISLIDNKILDIHIMADPGYLSKLYTRFTDLYSKGLKRFNILPVFYTKMWTKEKLVIFSGEMKKILDFCIEKKDIILTGFQENRGNSPKLINDSIFIDTDYKIYFTDFISTKLGINYKNEFFLGELENIGDLYKIDYISYNNKLDIILEEEIASQDSSQKKLHEIMDYFSVYLNSKKIQ